MIGAFLEARSQQQLNDHWYHESLLPAAQWLRKNNPYIAAYGHVLQTYVNASNLSHSPIPVWPTAEHIPKDQRAPPVHNGDVVVLNYDFPSDVHNEDSHYSRLMAGFICMRDNKSIPISFSSPDLEPQLFLTSSQMVMVITTK
jgi:hypothetical protein